MRCCLLLAIFCLCNNIFSQQHPAISLESLKEYEGLYRYADNRTLQIAASPRDSLLYAIVEENQYPLMQVERDIFTSEIYGRIVFTRDKKGAVNGYTLNGSTFPFIRKVAVDQRMWYAREPEGGKKLTYKRALKPKLNDGLDIGGLPASGLDKRLIQEMISRVAEGTYGNVHSILLLKNNKLVVEEYFYEYDRNSLHRLHDATASFISALAGIALGKGLIKNIDEPVISFFPEYRSSDSLNKPVTIRDLLTGDSAVVEDSAVSGGAVVLGKIIEKVSGQKLSDFARDNLFTPLGIRQYKWDFNSNKSGREWDGQLSLRPRDMAKFALLYTNNGQWNGKQIIAPGWIRESMSKQGMVNSNAYGFLWRLDNIDASGQRYDACVAKGQGGQRIFLFPKYNLIAVITGGSYNSQPALETMLANHVLHDLALRNAQ